ncbi:MAG: tRNA (adenosine(37)-N6)-threonylcarbamoyltransferase complex transferase subunit TsaD [Deltaproteobacteria bacterium]|nr:MAG: tRNA (adenosine(37)-N6)-threonylcarbamoyltransferase complex transferase subunit TsaD [Deltaproteobacteria bacterium]
MLILGIESSCDDTCAAVLSKERILSNVLSSQHQIHSRYGGVVPELASRQHLQSIHLIVSSALEKAACTLDDIELVAATQGPGLIGSLLVGFSYAKSLAAVKNIPFVGVDHLAGHILSILLHEPKPAFPYLALVVSGGTSSLYLAENYTSFQCLGRTRDDAAGEAFDKVAKILGFSYPGGPQISRSAEDGNCEAISFPRAWLASDSLDFSFSGLKTAVANYVQQEKEHRRKLHYGNICACFQEAVVEVLVKKTLYAARQYGIQTVVLGGGVAANFRLRSQMQKACSAVGIDFYCPELQLCTDNAAMIALAGWHAYRENGATHLDQDVYSRSDLG